MVEKDPFSFLLHFLNIYLLVCLFNLNFYFIFLFIFLFVFFRADSSDFSFLGQQCNISVDNSIQINFIIFELISSSFSDIVLKDFPFPFVFLFTFYLSIQIDTSPHWIFHSVPFRSNHFNVQNNIQLFSVCSFFFPFLNKKPNQLPCLCSLQLF